MENINKIDFEENKPYNAPHYPFSLEGPEGKSFHTRSRVFTAQELEELDQIGL